MTNKNNIQGFFKYIKERLYNSEVPYNEDHWSNLEQMLDKEFPSKLSKVSNFNWLLTPFTLLLTIVTLWIIVFNNNYFLDQKEDIKFLQQEQLIKDDKSYLLLRPEIASLANELKNQTSYTNQGNIVRYITKDFFALTNKSVSSDFTFTPIKRNSPILKESDKVLNKDDIGNYNFSSQDSNKPESNRGMVHSSIASNDLSFTNSNPQGFSLTNSLEVDRENEFLTFMKIRNSIFSDSLSLLQDSIGLIANYDFTPNYNKCDTCFVPFFADKFIYPIEFIYSSSFQNNAAFVGSNKASITYSYSSLLIDPGFIAQIALGKKKRLGLGANLQAAIDSTYSLKKEFWTLPLFNKHLINLSTSYLLASLPNHKIRIGGGLTYKWETKYLENYYTKSGDSALFVDTMSTSYSYFQANLGAMYYGTKTYLGLGINNLLLKANQDIDNKPSISIHSGYKIPITQNVLIIPHALLQFEKQNGSNSNLNFSNAIGIDMAFLTRGAMLQNWVITGKRKSTNKSYLIFGNPKTKTNRTVSLGKKQYKITDSEMFYPNCITKSYLVGLGLSNFNTLVISYGGSVGLGYNDNKKRIEHHKASSFVKWMIPLTKEVFYENYYYDLVGIPFRIELFYSYHFN